MKTLGNILWHIPFFGFVNAISCLHRLISKRVILTISMIMTMTLTNLANAAGSIEGYIGGGIPTGDHVADQYGGLWLDLGAKYNFARSGNLSHNAFIDFFRGSSESSFITTNGFQATARAYARTVS